MRSLRSKIHAFSRLLALAGMVLLLPMMFITSADVAGRYLFATTIPGAMEISSLLLALFLLLGLSWTHQCKGHIQINFFVERLPLRFQAGISLVLNLLCAGMLCVLVIGGFQVAISEQTVTDMLRLPLAPFRMVLVAAAFSFLLEILCEVGDALQKMAGKR